MIFLRPFMEPLEAQLHAGWSTDNEHSRCLHHGASRIHPLLTQATATTADIHNRSRGFTHILQLLNPPSNAPINTCAHTHTCTRPHPTLQGVGMMWYSQGTGALINDGHVTEWVHAPTQGTPTYTITYNFLHK